MIHEICKPDSFDATIRVTSNGAAFPMTGATVVAVAKSTGLAVPGTVDMTQAAAGDVGVSFAAGSFDVGMWEVQVRATLGQRTQTIAREFIRVLPSL